MARLIGLFITLTATVALAATDRQGGGFGCCSLFFSILIYRYYRSGGVDWPLAVGATWVPGVFGWFIWRERGYASGPRTVALVFAALQALALVVGLVGALFAGQAARAALKRLEPTESLSKPVDLSTVPEDPGLGLHPPANLVTDPPGAKVFVDGKLRGVTPLETELTAGQRQELRVELDGYFPVRVDLAPNARERVEKRFTLQAAARLEVKTEPPGARVFVGRKLVLEKTPGLTGPLEAGEAEVLVLRDGAVPVAQRLTLEVGTRPLELALPSGVKVSVTSTPADAELFVDGQWVGQTPADVFVSPKGKHTLELEKEPFARAKRPLASVTKPTRVDVVLIDTERLAAAKAVDRARARYDKLNDTLEKLQDKFEHTAHPSAKQERQLDALDKEMARAATALEEAEAHLRELLEARAKDQPVAPKEEDDSAAP